jgi:uncharacterized protein involved in exopolysaccharide biosynthesis
VTETPASDDLDLQRYITVIWRRRYVIVAVTLVAVLTAAALSFFVLRRVYEASAVLLVSGPQLQVTNPNVSVSIGSGARLETSNTTFQPALGSVVTAQSVEPLVLNEVVAGLVARRLPGQYDAAPDRLERLMKKIKLAPVPGTGNFVKLTARDFSPAEAVALVRAWAGAISDYVKLISQMDARRTLASLDADLTSARARLAAAEGSLRDFEAGSSLPLLESQVQDTTRRIVAGESRLAEIAGDAASRGGASLPGSASAAPDGTAASSRSAAQLRAEIAALKSSLRASQSALTAERQREAQVRQQADLARSVYQALAQARDELQAVAGTNASTVTVAVPPVVPRRPVAPRPLQNIVLAAVLGAIGATFAVLLADSVGGLAPSPGPTAKPSGGPPAARARLPEELQGRSA